MKIRVTLRHKGQQRGILAPTRGQIILDVPDGAKEFTHDGRRYKITAIQNAPFELDQDRPLKATALEVFERERPGEYLGDLPANFLPPRPAAPLAAPPASEPVAPLFRGWPSGVRHAGKFGQAIGLASGPRIGPIHVRRDVA